jgi:hypothetical protein
VKLIDTPIAEGVRVAPEYMFLPSDAGLCAAMGEAQQDEVSMREVAEEALALMGLGQMLRPKEVIMKPHSKVAQRDAAVAEQFFHADVAVDGFCGILLVGHEGSEPLTVPETQTVVNTALLEHIQGVVKDGPLQDRLGEVLVVRPYLDPLDPSAWLDYPRHVLRRLEKPQFWELLTTQQQQHVDRVREWTLGSARYIDDVFISKLIREGVIDGTPTPSCGVGSREIRLALGGLETEEETQALASLHNAITLYLLGRSIVYGAQKVVQGSALLVPVDQLHKATPYDPSRHKRSIAAVKLYPANGQPAPASWQRASGLEY